METHLRLILLAVGIAVILGILLDAWRRKRAQLQALRLQRVAVEPTTDSEEFDIDDLGPILSSNPEPDYAAQKPVNFRKTTHTSLHHNHYDDYEPEENFEQKPHEEILVLHLMACGNHVLHGRNLVTALLSMNLHYGAKKIFHRHTEPNGTGDIIFSLVSTVEPGYFEPDTLDTFSTPGITLFMRALPSDEALHNFELMLTTARQLAARLDAQLQDEKRGPFTLQTIEQYRGRLRAVSKAHALHAEV